MSDPVESLDAFDERMLAKLKAAGVDVERTENGYRWTCAKLGQSGECGGNFGDLLLSLFTMVFAEMDRSGIEAGWHLPQKREEWYLGRD